jgi:5-methyltetrahydrofolate--homocysteine methyltransferase
MAIDIASALKAPKVADGAWGTELDKLGCPAGYCREEWNVSHPELVGKVAAAYVQAGSDVILTNTFSANAFTLERHGMAGRVEAFNCAGAEISRQAAGKKVWVFGSMGPSGKMLVAEEVTEDELYKAFFAQAKALAAGGADAILCETFTELQEILTAARAAKDATGLPVVASLTYDTGPDYTRTMMGVAAGDAAEALTKAGADVIGCNCGVGIDAYVKVARCLRQHTDRPIWVKPNAGLPEMFGAKVVYKEGPEEFAAKVHLLLEAGANFVGGCCGTTPDHIRKLAAAVKARRS